MTVESYNPSLADELPVRLTEKALQHFYRQLSASQDRSVRLSVKESGCTGFKYVLDMVQTAEQGDIAYELPYQDTKVSILVAADSLKALKGLELDYKTQGLNSTIEFNNPNAVDHCGCGESFSIVDDSNE